MAGLIIVESPNKAKKISKLYPGMVVKATVGHFRDLPVRVMGVAPPDHEPVYDVDPDKEKVLAAIRKAANNADTIWIAADPDREGEAIAWHTQYCLGQKHRAKCKRITFTEVNKRAIDAAMAAPRGIDRQQVRAQEARRVVDRYVGYLVSPVLKAKLVALGAATEGARISAGRVQSVAVKLLVELEDTIAQFEPVEHYGVRAHLTHGGVDFFADWDFKGMPTLPEGQRIWTDNVTAEYVRETATSLELVDATQDTKAVTPYPPLTTSDLVKSANRLFKFSTKKTMDLAQRLFENGWITYHRTDSPAMSAEFVATVRAYATAEGLPLPEQPRVYRASGDAQEGHECCRVTDIATRRPEGLADEDPFKLYRMIWDRTLASQLADEQVSVSVLRFVSPPGYAFVTRSTRQTFAGWREVIPAAQKTAEDEPAAIPALAIGVQLPVTAAVLQVKQTQPPSRWMERNLVAELEKRGIGRPSTYASIISTILNRAYAQYNAKQQVVPTALGVVMCQAIDQRFAFMDYQYTARIEALLDQIARGKQAYLPIVDGVYQQTTQELQWFQGATLDLSQAPVDEARALSAASGQGGKKNAARKTPNAQKSRAAHRKTQGKPLVSGSPCTAEGCKGTRLERQIKSGNNAGKRYLGCSHFPTCKQFDWLE